MDAMSAAIAASVHERHQRRPAHQGSGPGAARPILPGQVQQGGGIIALTRSFPRARAELRKDDTRKSRSPLRPPPFPRECGADNEQYCQWEQYCHGPATPTGRSSRSAASLVEQVAEGGFGVADKAPPRATAKFAAGDLTSIAKSDAGDSREPREEGGPTLGLDWSRMLT